MLGENRFVQAAVAALPLLLTPLLLIGIAEGWLNFDGGEKDLLLAIPYLIGTLAFLLCAIILILKRRPDRRWLPCSAMMPVLLLVGLAIVAYFGSVLGVTER